VLDVLPEKSSQLRQDQPCIIVFSILGERTQISNFVFESAGGWDIHRYGDGGVLGRGVFVGCPTFGIHDIQGST